MNDIDDDLSGGRLGVGCRSYDPDHDAISKSVVEIGNLRCLPTDVDSITTSRGYYFIYTEKTDVITKHTSADEKKRVGYLSSAQREQVDAFLGFTCAGTFQHSVYRARGFYQE